MGGGLMQLVAYGAQDVYLTGNPQITFFKVVYRRHTNFSIEMDELPIDIAKPGSSFSVQILRNGDLATRMYLRLQTPDLTSAMLTYNEDQYQNGKIAWVRRLGHACVKQFKIQIGGTDIDKHVGTWLDIWYELTHTATQERGYNAMIGDVPEMTQLVACTNISTDVLVAGYTMYIPLQFWFNRNPGLALPLIALQYHDVRLYVDLQDINKLIVWSGASAPNLSNFQYQDAGIMVDYIYLDSEERRRFAQVGHEYLIEQVQFPAYESLSGTSSTVLSQKFKLNFNHPCKELVWALTCGAYNGAGTVYATGGRGRYLCYTNDDSQWNAALDYAAANLMTGALVPTGETNTRAGAVLGGYIALPTTVGIVNGATALVSTQLTTAGGNTVYVSATVTNASGSDVTAGTGRQLFQFTTNALVLGTYGNLLESLARVNVLSPNALVTLTCNVTSVASGAPTAVALTNIAVTGHALSLTDVSIPVEDFVDCRWNTASNNKNAYDVTVIQPSNYGLRLDGAGNPVAYGNIQLNGHDRFDVREGSYFNYVQPYQHHTRTPADGINVYSFGLHPEDHQPSGTCNLSRIDTTMLNLSFSDAFRANQQVPQLNYVQDSRFFIFAVNYNVLRIMSGMGGLAYSN